MTTEAPTTAERLAELDAEHRAAEQARDKLLASKAPQHKVLAAWHDVKRLAVDCHALAVVRVAELEAEEAAV